MQEAANQQFSMRVSPEFVSRIDDWRRKQDDLPPRAEAVRRLVVAGLAAVKEESAA